MTPFDSQIYMQKPHNYVLPRIGVIRSLKELQELLDISARKQQADGDNRTPSFGWNLYPEQIFVCSSYMDHEIILTDPYAWPDLYKQIYRKYPRYRPHKESHGKPNKDIVKLILKEMEL